MKFDALEAVIEDVKAGKPVVIVDAKDRENEGDLMVAGELITPESMNFMIEHGKGLICLSLTKERLSQLNIPLQVSENTAPLGTNFTVSIDHRSCVGQGVTASGRAKTMREASLPDAVAEDFVRPGFVFPLSAVTGGTLRRSGQTEGSVDLAILAGLNPAGVICEIMSADGRMLRGNDLVAYCQRHSLKITSVVEIAQHRLRYQACIRRVAQADLPSLSQLSAFAKVAEIIALPQASNLPLKVCVYVDDADDEEHLAIIVGNPVAGALTRIHSECLTGDIFGSLRCDCGGQLAHAFASMAEEGSGVLVYLHQEGRGIGLGNKLRAYELQDSGLDTVDANLKLGFAADGRNYRVGAQILRDLGLSSVRLMTNNPDKVSALQNLGVEVAERIPLPPVEGEHNLQYLRTKRERMGHLL